MDLKQLQERVEQLETRLAFQDDTIDQLNDEIAVQQQQLEKHRVQMQYLMERLNEMKSAQSNIASMSEETPPPHY